MKRGFFGGIHPPGGKELTAQGAVQRVKPRRLSVPLLQHIGGPCTPTVSAGEQVAAGQVIGIPTGLGAAIHAPVSGTVLEVTQWPRMGGGSVLSVVIDNDFADREAPLPPMGELTAQTILARIAQAGIVGMGGAAFPTAVKLEGAVDRADTLIANGCECEPFVTADEVLLTTDPRRVLRGLELLRRTVHPKRTVLAVEEDKRLAIEGLRRCMADFPDIELCVLPARYPQGSEKQLIRAVTGREVLTGALPVAVGCAVCNVSTCAAVHDAVELRRPLTHRLITVSGPAVQRPGNYLAPVGTTLRDLLQAAGGLAVTANRVLGGGPMMGVAQTDLTAAVTKATNALTCLPPQPEGTGQRCIRCGRCVMACPMHLQPLYLYRFLDSCRERERLHFNDCITCGCCSYICPARLPLTEQFREEKQRERRGKS